MKYDDIVAVLCSDIHLSHKPPRFRTAEANWYYAMRRVLEEVQAVVNEYDVPLVVAGDIFDCGWQVHKCPPELISFAIKHLPPCYAVPGQHDLPNHRYEDIGRSGYQTLVEAGVIKDIPPGQPIAVKELILHGFPWGYPIRPRVDATEHTFGVHLAVVHSYLWTQGCSYEGADPEAHYTKKIKDWEGYDAVVYGDNHKGFLIDGMGLGDVLNCGTLMIRKADESDYRPSIGLLHRDGKISRHYLDTSKDKYSDIPGEIKPGHTPIDVSQFVGGLATLSKGLYDFEEAAIQAVKIRPMRPGTKEVILRSLVRKK